MPSPPSAGPPMTMARQTRYWLVGLVAALLLLYLLRDILLPFVAAMAVAYFLDPVADRLERWGLPRWLAAVAVLFLFFFGVLLVIVLLVPLVQSQMAGFFEHLPAYLQALHDRGIPFVMDLLHRLNIDPQTDVRNALGRLASDAVTVAGQIVQGAVTGGLAFINILSLVVITPIVAFYLLRDWDHIVAHVDSWLPRQHAPTLRRLFADIDAVMANFLRGQGTVCLVLGTFYAVGLTLAGLEFGLVIGIISGLISFIPFVGATVGLLLSLVPAITQFWPDYWRIGIVIGIFAAGQAIEGNVLTPRLLGDKVGLHPVWVMFALLAGGTLFGFLGVLMAVPVAAAAGVLVRFLLQRYRASPLFLGEEASRPARVEGAGAPEADGE